MTGTQEEDGTDRLHLLMPPDWWLVRLKDGSLVSIKAHACDQNGDDLVFELMMAGTPNWMAESVRIPKSAVQDWEGGLRGPRASDRVTGQSAPRRRWRSPSPSPGSTTRWWSTTPRRPSPPTGSSGGWPTAELRRALRCLGYRQPLFLGGVDESENLELSDLDVYWTIMGQLRIAAFGLGGG